MAYDNPGLGPLRVPGMSVVSWLWEESLRRDARSSFLADGIEDWMAKRLTVRELAMLRLMNSITDKPEWDRKVFDDAIVDKWRTEAVGMPLISEHAWNWVLQEVRDKAKAFQTSRTVSALDSSARCVKSDVLIDPDLRAELLAGVTPLLSVSEGQKDWHPGANGQVLNLVHPSLFPLVYGRTRVLTQGGRVGLMDMLASCGQGEVVEADDVHPLTDVWSARFQWLPCEVEFVGSTEDDTSVRITSYINNLHPAKHQALYRTIEKFIGISVPLWNDVVLCRFGASAPLRIQTYGAEWAPAMPEWAQYQNMETALTDDNVPEVMQKVKEYLAQPDRPGYSPDVDDEDIHEDIYEDIDMGDDVDSLRDIQHDPERVYARLERRLARIGAHENARPYHFGIEVVAVVERKWKRIRSVAHPEPGTSVTYDQWKAGIQTPIIAGHDTPSPDADPMKVSLHQSNWFRNYGLQVIVKLASIELTPDNPRYPGGNWHLEGMKNEHIVATSIYYYDVENVTPSSLSFRQHADLDEMALQYEQDDHEPLSTVFGTNSMRDEPAVQELGGISTPEGRILAFPNTLQHKVEPFELVDKTKPGHRRFLVLWLVDPHFRIFSTRNVPPQRHDWWAEGVLDMIDFRPLPAELVDMVKDEIGEWPMGLEEAKALRIELMAERTMRSEAAESNFGSYNLCEH